VENAVAAISRPRDGQRQLLVDVSALIHQDLKTGIQRVVRSVLLSLMASPPAGLRVEPVFSLGGNCSYQYACDLALSTTEKPERQQQTEPVKLGRGDVFLGLDLSISGTAQNRQLLQSMREHGVGVYFVVYDILPILRPDTFPVEIKQDFSAYLDTISSVSDGLVCISRAVADELTDWLAQHPPQRQTPLKIGHFHLGADIDASAPSFGLPHDFEQVLHCVSLRPSFLMVGTVEPRKGHEQTLSAFDLLWKQGIDVNLVVVGKDGWMMEHVVLRMKTHSERKNRLFWLPDATDEMLLTLYRSASALVAASEGEGFGLPLIEAARHGLPIISRELPVFVEIAGAHAHYFKGLKPHDLSQAIQTWIAMSHRGSIPLSTKIPWLNWEQSTQQLLDAVERKNWYREFTPDLAKEAAELSCFL
jgi:glycosyltransferase involved in cell wall biosynthesis